MFGYISNIPGSKPTPLFLLKLFSIVIFLMTIAGGKHRLVGLTKLLLFSALHGIAFREARLAIYNETGESLLLISKNHKQLIGTFQETRKNCIVLYCITLQKCQVKISYVYMLFIF
jgi:hypothetical protein